MGPTTFADVDIRAALAARPTRPPDLARERDALVRCLRAFAGEPGGVFQELSEVALDLCRAHSAGVSLLEGDLVRWVGAAGACAVHRHRTLARADAPCAVCVDSGVLLMDRPDRCFSALPMAPPFVELLVVPFAVDDEPAGTTWIVAHSDDRRFDRGDEEILRTIGALAAVGCQGRNLYASAVLANRHKDEFLAMLGHEMRSPIGAIVAAIAALQSAIVAPARTTSALLDVLARQTRHLARLVNDLNDLSRIGKGKLDVQLAPVDCGTVVDDAVGIVRPGIERRQQHLEVHIAPEPIEVLADAARLTQVFVNLLDNVAKYTPEGGKIHVSVVREDGEACVVVRDTGIGIAPQNLGDVFKPFTPLMPAGAHSEGLGLGLALAERLAKLHGGVITRQATGAGRGARSPCVFRWRAAHPDVTGGNAPSDG